MESVLIGHFDTFLFFSIFLIVNVLKIYCYILDMNQLEQFIFPDDERSSIETLEEIYYTNTCLFHGYPQFRSVVARYSRRSEAKCSDFRKSF